MGEDSIKNLINFAKVFNIICLDSEKQKQYIRMFEILTENKKIVKDSDAFTSILHSLLR